MTVINEWPADDDGDALRMMRENGFDFDQDADIDFMVDFEAWPPAPAILDLLEARYPGIELFEPEDGELGYVQFVVAGRLTYELVRSVQAVVSEVARPYGGVCEAWGVYFKPDAPGTDDDSHGRAPDGQD